jgi:hypothetical protein
LQISPSKQTPLPQRARFANGGGAFEGSGPISSKKSVIRQP